MGLYQIVLTKHHHNIIVYTNNDLKLRINYMDLCINRYYMLIQWTSVLYIVVKTCKSNPRFFLKKISISPNEFKSAW